MNVNVVINKHSSICINNDIYIDPYGITKPTKNAKAIFITHSHYDHLDMESIKNIANSDTIIIAPADAISMLQEEGYDDNNLKVVAPNQSGEAYDILYETFASYNLNKKFHPKQNGWVGYNLTIGGLKFAICGDSDNTPELQAIKTDILLVPVGGTYTMNAIEAAALTNIIKPRLAIPTHYGSIVGDKQDGETFASLVLPEIRVVELIK